MARRIAEGRTVQITLIKQDIRRHAMQKPLSALSATGYADGFSGMPAGYILA